MLSCFQMLSLFHIPNRGLINKTRLRWAEWKGSQTPEPDCSPGHLRFPSHPRRTSCPWKRCPAPQASRSQQWGQGHGQGSCLPATLLHPPLPCGAGIEGSRSPAAPGLAPAHRSPDRTCAKGRATARGRRGTAARRGAHQVRCIVVWAM